MKIENLKDFNKLVKLCRQLGVNSIRVGDVEVHLGALPLKKAGGTSASSYSPPKDLLEQATIANDIQYVEDKVDSDELTEEQMMFYSAVPQGDVS